MLLLYAYMNSDGAAYYRNIECWTSDVFIMSFVSVSKLEATFYVWSGLKGGIQSTVETELSYSASGFLVFLSNLYREISVISVEAFFCKVKTLKSDLFQRAIKVRTNEVFSEIPFLRNSYFEEPFNGI